MRFEEYVLTPAGRKLFEGLTEEDRRYWSAFAGVDLPRPSTHSICRAKLGKRRLIRRIAGLRELKPYVSRKYSRALASVGINRDAFQLRRG